MQETEDDLVALGRRFKNRRLSIVISNWEGDNLVYCGHLTVFRTLAKRAVCSYSAYDSSGRGTLEADLPRILATCDRVIIGELGFDLKRGDRKALTANIRALPPGLSPANPR